MAGSVDDVDANAAIGNGDVLREDRYPPLPLQIVSVEKLLADELRVAEPPALAQHAIHQAGLAVIDVRDNSHIADVFASHGNHLLGEAWFDDGETIQYNGLAAQR